MIPLWSCPVCGKCHSEDITRLTPSGVVVTCPNCEFSTLREYWYILSARRVQIANDMAHAQKQVEDLRAEVAHYLSAARSSNQISSSMAALARKFVWVPIPEQSDVTTYTAPYDGQVYLTLCALPKRVEGFANEPRLARYDPYDGQWKLLDGTLVEAVSYIRLDLVNLP